MKAKKEIMKQNCKSQPNANEEASILKSVQDLNFKFGIQTKIHFWPLLKMHPNFFRTKIISSLKTKNSNFQGYVPVSKTDWISLVDNFEK